MLFLFVFVYLFTSNIIHNILYINSIKVCNDNNYMALLTDLKKPSGEGVLLRLLINNYNVNYTKLLG